MITIIEESIEFLQNIGLPKQEFYFVLASLLVYLNKPFSDESWNTFKKKFINKEISIEDGLFMSHEEKNPGVFKYKKTDLVHSIDIMILHIKRDLEKKFPNLYRKQTSDIVCIPDVIKSYDEPTFFSKKYIENQIQNSDYTNKLTGHPFSWEFVESIKTNSIRNILNTPTNNTNKKISLENIIKYIKRELDVLYKTTKYCMICKKKKVEHKSVQNYRFVYFCSLECMDKWNID